MNWKYHLNSFLYIIGSCLFIVGSILFHPHFSTAESLYKTGIFTFTFGSILFCSASLQQLFANFQSIKPNQNILIDEVKPFDIYLAASFCRNTIGSISGLLFIIGSVAFWPSYGHDGAIVGNWFYRCGASFGVVNSIWMLVLEHTKSPRFSMLKLMTLLSLFGSIGFLIGGAYFLYGGTHDVEGSFAWLSGSIAFLLSSLLIYVL